MELGWVGLGWVVFDVDGDGLLGEDGEGGWGGKGRMGNGRNWGGGGI